jgi:hypothetical protein
MSDSFDVAWGPGPRILYQRAGNQNYYELDPDTGAERLLVPEGSPDGVGPVYCLTQEDCRELNRALRRASDHRCCRRQRKTRLSPEGLHTDWLVQDGA